MSLQSLKFVETWHFGYLGSKDQGFKPHKALLRLIELQNLYLCVLISPKSNIWTHVTNIRFVSSDSWESDMYIRDQCFW